MLSSCVSCPDDSRPERRFIRCLPKETHRVSKETHTVSEQTRRFIRCLCVCLCVFVCVCVCVATSVALRPSHPAHERTQRMRRGREARACKHCCPSGARIAAPQVHALLPLRCTHCCPCPSWAVLPLRCTPHVTRRQAATRTWEAGRAAGEADMVAAVPRVKENYLVTPVPRETER
jgi:hypothetical protein